MAKQVIDNQMVENVVQDFDIEVNEEWAVEFLKRAYTTKTNFGDEKKLKKYRGIDKGEWDAEDLIKLKNFFDPKNKDTQVGGDAEYMRTDWKPCPLIQSLTAIIKKQIKTAISELSVKGSDKLSIDKKAKEKLRVLNRKNMIDNINLVLSITGHPPISYDENVDKVIASFSKEKNDKEVADVPNIIDQIKAEIDNDFDFSVLAETGMLKDGVEIAHEEMISHYMDHCKWEDNIAEQVITDYMHGQRACYRFYTSAMNGLPETTYVDPLSISVSPFQQKDGGDLDYWFYSFVTTWSEYMKMVGGRQTLDKNKAIYMANKTSWYSSNPDFDANQINPTFGFMNSTIKLGYIEIKKHVHDPNTNTYYDVIKKFYYLPVSAESLKKEFIIDLGNLQDMHRKGSNLAYADFSLVIRQDSSKMSFYDIMNVEFQRMNKIYNQYLNTFAAFFPEGVLFATEPLVELAKNIIQEVQESGKETDAMSEQAIMANIVRRIKMSGGAVLPKRKGDNDEERMDNLTSIMENKILIDCAGLINQLMTLYNLMLMSLGINPNRLAQEPKPRTTNASIQGATSQSAYATMELEEAYSFFKKEFGSRMLYYDQQVITEFDKNIEPVSERAKEMASLIGVKGINWLEVYNDMPYQRCVLKIEDKPTQEDRMMLYNYVTQLELNKAIPIGTFVTIQSIDNLKLAKLFVQTAIKRQNRIAVENQMAMQQQAGEQQQAAIQSAQQAQAADKEQDAQTKARITALEEQLQTEGKLRAQNNSAANKKDIADHEAGLKQAEKQTEALV